MLTAIFIAAIGFVVFVLAVLGLQDWEFLRRPRQRVLGTVYDHRSERNDSRTFFFAQIRFKTDDGRVVEFVDIVGHSSPRPPVGGELDVVYPVEAPESARVPRPWSRIAVYCGLSVGLACLIFGSIVTLP